MKKLGILFIFALILVGCSSAPKDTVLVCKSENEFGTSEMELRGEGDKALNSKNTNFTSVEALLTGYEVDQAGLDVLISDISITYNAIEGVSYTHSFVDDKLKELILVDYTVSDLNALAEVGLVDDVEGLEHISLKVTQDSFEKLGAVCTLN